MVHHSAPRVRGWQAAMSVLFDEISTGVGAHTRDLVDVGQRVNDLEAGGGFEDIQHVIIQQISDVVEVNRKLEDDLNCTKYELQQQEDELDRTRRGSSRRGEFLRSGSRQRQPLVRT